MIMAYMCMGCYEIYDYDMDMCPKAGCEGMVVEIDELMVPIIKLLNEKGYMTAYCCSGHVYGNGATAYICLDEFMTEIFEAEEMRKLLPESWKMGVDSFGRINFTHMLKYNDTESEQYKDILKANMEFYEFVEKLPVLEY